MKVSPQGIDLITHFEGFYPNAYQCSADVWTIGYGTTSTKAGGHDDGTIAKGMEVDEEQAEVYLKQDLGYFDGVVNKNVTVDLTQDQFDSLVSFTFNLGEGNFKKSTLLRRLNEGNYKAAANEFIKWNKAGGEVLNGLTRRRASEERLFKGEDSYLIASTEELGDLGYPVV